MCDGMRIGSNESSKSISETERALFLGGYQLFTTICVFTLTEQIDMGQEKGIRMKVGGSIDTSRTPFQKQATSECSLAHLPTGW